MYGADDKTQNRTTAETGLRLSLSFEGVDEDFESFMRQGGAGLCGRWKERFSIVGIAMV